MNINPNIQNSQDNNSSLMHDKTNEDNNQDTNTNTTNNRNNPITADTTTEANRNTQWQLESTHDITYAPQAHTQCQPINNLYLIGSNTS